MKPGGSRALRIAALLGMLAIIVVETATHYVSKNAEPIPFEQLHTELADAYRQVTFEMNRAAVQMKLGQPHGTKDGNSIYQYMEADYAYWIGFSETDVFIKTAFYTGDPQHWVIIDQQIRPIRRAPRDPAELLKDISAGETDPSSRTPRGR